MNTILNSLSQNEKNKSFVSIYKDGAMFEVPLTKLLDSISGLNLVSPTVNSNPLLPISLINDMGIAPTPVNSSKLAVTINGTIYYLLATIA